MIWRDHGQLSPNSWSTPFIANDAFFRSFRFGRAEAKSGPALVSRNKNGPCVGEAQEPGVKDSGLQGGLKPEHSENGVHCRLFPTRKTS
jgi:hypothetical protein